MSDISVEGAREKIGSTAGGAINTDAVQALNSDANAQDFAILMSDMLKTQATAQLATAMPGGGMSGTDYFSGGTDMSTYLLSSLFGAVSNGDDIDPELASLLLCALTGADSGAFGSALTAGTGNIDIGTSGLDMLRTVYPMSDNAGGRAVPENAWVAASPEITGNASCRSADLLNKIIGQFDVESSVRYQPYKHGSDTYCNIFVWDVTSALGAEIPHYIDAATGSPRNYPDVNGAAELGANGTYDWLAGYGKEYGWTEVSAEEAQNYANSGYPAVTAWKNTSGGAGHVQVVCPSKDGKYDTVRGVTVAQAGSNNYEYAHLSSTFSSSRLPQVKYYVHA
ncbi:MAG: hypothetical protein AB7C97_03140 [Oscillospiraceae bacterium]